MSSKFLRKTPVFRGVLAASTFLLSIFSLAGILLEDNGVMVDETFKTQREKTITTDDGQLYTAFKPEDVMTDGYLDAEKATKLSDDYNTAVGEEGTVLLKNENSVLPLKSAKKVTALGWYSHKCANVNSWTGTVSGENYLIASLKNNGIEINQTAIEAYDTKDIGRYPSPGYANNKCWGKITYDEYYQTQSLTNTDTGASVAFNPHEPTLAELETAKPGFTASLSEYNDAALVFLGRASAEGADYKAGPDGMASTADTGARTPLALTDGERAILNVAKEKFDKVVVILNCTNTMEIGELATDSGIDAILYAPNFNEKNVQGLCNVLTGKANPSGGLNNIYASNTLSSPAMMNQGFYRYTNADQIHVYKDKADKGDKDGRIDTSTIGTNGTDVGYTNYLIEAEGIYVGYRYYETRYFDCVTKQGNASAKVGVYDSTNGWNYSEEVVYSFGYGLSYTTFEKTIKDVKFIDSGVHTKNHEKYADVTVNVKNTGTVAGKTSVQIYGQSPYTDYDKENGVEKSAVQLLEYGKTGILEAGADTDITVRVDLADLASYDSNKAKTYIMDKTGDYYFATGNGAHDALNNILASMGKTTGDGMDYNGSSKAAYKWNYTSSVEGTVDDFTFSVSKNGTKITNQLDNANWDYYGDQKVTYLTRNHWDTTYPKSYTGMTATDTMLKYLNGHYIDEVKSTAAELAEVKLGQTTDLKFGDMKFAEYNDYRWDELLSSLNLDELIEFCYKGGRNFSALSIGFPAGNYAENGATSNLAYSTEEGAINPTWLKEGTKAGEGAKITLSDYAVMACTFSHELSKTYGKLSGIGGILGERVFLWQPGANTLRTPYNGRSAQYYSEDPVLTGVNVMEAHIEAIKYGGIITAKHFGINDQELGRSGMGTFVNEQRAREIELHAFQIGVECNQYDTEDKDESLMGLMTSFAKMGAVETTCNKNLMTNILQDEWGFQGYAVSDLKDDLDLAPQVFKSGMTGYDYRTASDDVDPYLATEQFRTDAELQNCMKEMAHRELWCFANSSLMNKVNSTSYSVWNMTWWRELYIIGIAVAGAFTAASLILFGISLALNSKGEN